MRYLEIRPRAPTAESVRCHWFLTGTGTGTVAVDAAAPALPDGSPELILNLADPFHAVAADGSSVPQPMAMLVGQITRPFAVRPGSRVDLAAVRLEAFGMAPFVADASTLTDRFIDVARQFDGRIEVARRQLAETPDPTARAAILDVLVDGIRACGRAADDRVVAAVRGIRMTHGILLLDELAASLGLTMRTLQRRFALDVGISPKQLARMIRFQRVFAVWRDDRPSLARVAAECGYFDESHLARDFRDLAGLSPAAFLRSIPEFTRHFTAASPKESARTSAHPVAAPATDVAPSSLGPR
jgi:AraC-like DNA-binding protein